MKLKTENRIFGVLIALLLAVGVSIGVVKAEIDGKAEHGNWGNEANRIQASRIKNNYESHEFACAGADQDFKVTQSAFRIDGTGVIRAHTITVRTDGDITIRFNSLTNDAISLSAAEATLTWNITEVTNIFFSCGAGANLKVTLG